MSREKQEQDAESSPPRDDARGLSQKQEIALRALVAHPTLREAALASGLNESTLWRYRKDADFAGRLREAQREARRAASEQTSLGLQVAGEEAVGVLREVMRKEDAPPAARVRAASVILGYALRAAELEEVKTRLDELERFILSKQEGELLERAQRPG